MLNPGSLYYQGKKNWRGKDKEKRERGKVLQDVGGKNAQLVKQQPGNV